LLSFKPDHPGMADLCVETSSTDLQTGASCWFCLPPLIAAVAILLPVMPCRAERVEWTTIVSCGNETAT